jgi:hypothetical protein
MNRFSRPADPRLAQKNVDRAVVDRLVGLLPLHWTRVTLALAFTYGENGRVTIDTVISNPEGNSDRVQPTQPFFEATHALIDPAVNGGRRLKKASYTLEKRTDATWDHRVKREY